jgi:hypothetical protein
MCTPLRYYSTKMCLKKKRLDMMYNFKSINLHGQQQFNPTIHNFPYCTDHQFALQSPISRTATSYLRDQ